MIHCRRAAAEADLFYLAVQVRITPHIASLGDIKIRGIVATELLMLSRHYKVKIHKLEPFEGKDLLIIAIL